MNENQLLQPTDFDIQRLDLVTKFGSVDLRGMFEEINLYDSMLAPCATGNMLIVDAIGLSQKLLLDGTIIFQSLSFFKKRRLLFLLPLVEIFYVIYILIIGIIANIGGAYEWKGRTVN